jgi:hypothetical protein
MKNFLDHEKFFNDSQKNSKRGVRKSRTNSADLIKIKSEKKLILSSNLTHSRFKKMNDENLKGKL